VSKATPFTQLTIGERVLLSEQVRRDLKRLSREVVGKTLPSDFTLTADSQGWLELMRNQLCNHCCSDGRFLELDAELCDYYETVSEVEAEELRRRLSEFAFIRGAVIDADANAHEAIKMVGPPKRKKR